MPKKLDLKGLLKLAEKNKEKACKQYSEIYGADQVSFFDNFYHSDQKLGYKVNPNKRHITIENADTMKKFLCHFGHLMKELKVLGDDDPTFTWDDIMELLYSHCDALKKLHLFNDITSDDPVDLVMRKIARAKGISQNPLCLTEPLSTVERLKIEHIFLDTPLKIDELFPKLRALDLYGTFTSDTSMIEVHVPQMEHFGITIDKSYELLSDAEDRESSDGLDVIVEEDESKDNKKDENKDTQTDGKKDKSQFDWANIKNMLALNPQLQSIYLDMNINISKVQFIKETLPNLKKIEISFVENDFDDHTLQSDIVFENINSASLGHLGKCVPPVTFEKLENLDFTTSDHQSVIDFIQKHQHIKCLDLHCEYSDTECFNIIKSLPELKDLYMVIENQIKWSARGLLRFLAECERLETLMLMLEVDSKDQRNWRSLVSNVWQIEEGYTRDVYTIEKIEATSHAESIKSLFLARKPSE